MREYGPVTPTYKRWTESELVMVRKTFVLLLVAMTTSFVGAQVKIEGPKDGTVGYRSKAKLTLDGVQDPQIKCFPANDDWMAVQDWAGNKYIDFVPGKKLLQGPDGKYLPSKLFTFVVAANKDNKTFLETWELNVTPDGEIVPIPPGPAPVPVPDSELEKSLQAAYLVSPDGPGLAKLTAVYEDFKAQIDLGKFTNNKEAMEYLKSKAPPVLQGVKDAVAAYLVTNAPRGTQWDKDKLSAAIGSIVAGLKKLAR